MHVKATFHVAAGREHHCKPAPNCFVCSTFQITSKAADRSEAVWYSDECRSCVLTLAQMFKKALCYASKTNENTVVRQKCSGANSVLATWRGKIVKQHLK